MTLTLEDRWREARDQIDPEEGPEGDPDLAAELLGATRFLGRPTRWLLVSYGDDSRHEVNTLASEVERSIDPRSLEVAERLPGLAEMVDETFHAVLSMAGVAAATAKSQ
jgi:hypothetical protein